MDRSQHSSGTPELSSSPLKESLPLPLTVEDFDMYLWLHIKALASLLAPSASFHPCLLYISKARLTPGLSPPPLCYLPGCSNSQTSLLPGAHSFSMPPPLVTTTLALAAHCSLSSFLCYSHFPSPDCVRSGWGFFFPSSLDSSRCLWMSPLSYLQ